MGVKGRENLKKTLSMESNMGLNIMTWRSLPEPKPRAGGAPIQPPLKTVGQFLKIQITPESHTRHLSQENENLYPHKNLYTNFHNKFIYNSRI